MKRMLSIAIGLMAYIGPPIWAALAIEDDRRAQSASHGWVCGNPVIGIMLLASITVCALSLCATGIGVAALRAIPEPRPAMRLLELGFVFLPFVVAGCYVTLLMFT